MGYTVNIKAFQQFNPSLTMSWLHTTIKQFKNRTIGSALCPTIVMNRTPPWDSGRSVEKIASELGISSNTLFNWKKQYLEDSQNAFPGKGKMKPEGEELRQKDKEIAMLKMERDILKKAIAYFAKVDK